MDTIQFLSNKIHLLELKIDSIQKAESLKELSIRINEQADIVSNVGSFYESAWLKLIIVISLLGIIVPFLIQYFQRSNLKEVAEFLSKEVKDVFELKIKNLKETNETQFNNLSEKINTELLCLQNSYETISFEVEASLLYLQGKQNFNTNKYGSALHDYIRSTEFWLKSSKPERVGVLLQNIKLCITNFKTLSLFEKALSDFNIEWETFMKLMEEKTSSKERIEDIKASISKLIN